eukprot:CCRYP_006888-RA/>CCRYP_006888-RA protein AED:0.31 eAED:0.31 QI:0/-1/0/1/-1/1/1/0/937
MGNVHDQETNRCVQHDNSHDLSREENDTHDRQAMHEYIVEQIVVEGGENATGNTLRVGALTSPMQSPLGSVDQHCMDDEPTSKNASFDDNEEGDEYFDRYNENFVRTPTTTGLQQMESLPRNNLEDKNSINQKFGYKRSCSMEPLFDDFAEKQSNTKPLLILKTVLSTDCDDEKETEKSPEVVALSPSYEEHSSPIDEAMVRDIFETTSSTNGVYIEDGNEVNVSRLYMRSSSMQPIFDRDSSEKLSSADPFTYEESLTTAIHDSQMTCLEKHSPNATGETRKRLSDPSSPIVYELSTHPASPLLSDIHTEIQESEAFGQVCAKLTGVSLSHDSASEIGGDTYFDRNSDDGTTNDESSSLVGANNRAEDAELMQPIALPPRLKRTTAEPDSENLNIALDFPLTPGRARQNDTTLNTLPASPRRNFTHTHSLLDDCSDEEDDISSFTMVDSPTRHTLSYSCFPKKHINNHRSSYVSYFKKQKPNKQREQQLTNTVHATVDNNIHQAMLQTRHRRWTCQSALAGSHAQSNQLFDLSNRVQYVSIPDNKTNWKSNQNRDFSAMEEDNGERIVLATISVSHAAIRAGALACGLWRTVRLVRLPRGLFEKHWLLWKDKQYSFEEVYDENDVWSLLQMLKDTFPLLDQIDFGGDISEGCTQESYHSHAREEWKKEIFSRILQIVPNLIAIDGFDVDGHDVEKDPPDPPDMMPMPTETMTDQVGNGALEAKHEDNLNCVGGSKETRKETHSSVTCDVCEPVDMQMCGWTQADGFQKSFSLEVISELHTQLAGVEAVASFSSPEHCSVAGDVSSDAIQDVSENILSMFETCVGPKHERKKSYTVDYPPLEPDSPEGRDTDKLLSSPHSSNSWGSMSSGNRPPTCPTSSKERRILPKPFERKKKGSMLKASLKRRVLGFIPSVSVMDDEEDSDENENVDECPTDLL